MAASRVAQPAPLVHADLDKALAAVKGQPEIHKNAPDHILRLLVTRCLGLSLDPMSGQLEVMNRGYTKDKGTRKAQWIDRWKVEARIDGLRAIAERTGKYAGQKGPYWCGDDGKWCEVWTKETPPAAAKVIVLKVIGGVIAETPAVAHYAEYRPPGDAPIWSKMGRNQIAKCAEALALRKAFPELAGLYVAEEMEQSASDGDVSPAEESAPPPREVPPHPAATETTASGDRFDPATGEVLEEAEAPGAEPEDVEAVRDSEAKRNVLRMDLQKARTDARLDEVLAEAGDLFQSGGLIRQHLDEINEHAERCRKKLADERERRAARG